MEKRSQEKKVSFADLLEESFQKRKKLEPGASFTGVVESVLNGFIFFRIQPDHILGTIAIEEFGTAKLPTKGESITAHFWKETHGEYRFVYCFLGEDLDATTLEMAKASSIPVWGILSTVSEKGAEIRLGKSFTAFCPISQIDKEFLEGKTSKESRFVITEFQPNAKKLVVSQKKFQDLEKKVRTSLLKSALQEGMNVTVVITSIQKQGIQVDLSGISAWVPASEASFRKNVDLEKEFQRGERRSGKILELDWAKDRIVISLKDSKNDPWLKQLPFSVGDLVKGTVESIKNFGIFVKLNEDFVGLVPNKEIGAIGKTHVGTSFSVGTPVDVFVKEIFPEKKQISLSIRKAKEATERVEYSKFLKEDSGASATTSLGAFLKKN